MKDSDQQYPEFADNTQVQITDLDPEGMPQQNRRAADIVAVLSTTVKTPWRRYGLIGACLLVLISVLFLQAPKQTPAPIKPPATPHPIVLEALAATNNRVYVQTGDNILASYQTTDGRALWYRELPSQASLLVNDQALYCYIVDAPDQGMLEELNMRNGQPLWSLSLPAAQAIDQVVLQQSGTLLSLSGVGKAVYVVRSDNGQIAWISQVPNQETGFTPGQSNIVAVQESPTTIDIQNADDSWEMVRFPTVFDGSQPLIDGSLLLLFPDPNQPGEQSIQVFRASDGKRLWSLPLANTLSVMNEQDGVIYLRAANLATVIALRASDGQRLWTFTTSDGQPFVATPVEQDGMLYLIQQNDVLVGIRAGDGQRAWQKQLPPLNEQSGGMQLLLAQGIFFLWTPPQGVGSTQPTETEALQASSGSILWHSTKLTGEPLVQSGILYTRQADGQLDAWRTNDGQHLWHTQVAIGNKLAPGLMSDPALVFLINALGEITVLRSSNGTRLWNYPASAT